MPYGRYPDRVKAFRKWASGKVDDSKLSESATASGARGWRKRRTRRRKRKKNAKD